MARSLVCEPDAQRRMCVGCSPRPCPRRVPGSGVQETADSRRAGGQGRDLGGSRPTGMRPDGDPKRAHLSCDGPEGWPGGRRLRHFTPVCHVSHTPLVNSSVPAECRTEGVDPILPHSVVTPRPGRLGVKFWVSPSLSPTQQPRSGDSSSQMSLFSVYF